MQVILVLTNFPDHSGAKALAEKLLNDRLAACVNVLPECTSFYRWQGQIETAGEIPLLIKTAARHYEAVEQAIKSLHPYELPEILAVPIGNGLPAYLQWVIDETNV
ncbi:divalent-cation tolerance protein CutA [Nitrosomonas halophila]|uniref:Divalent cation tolerance protein n=1 Tax=Nitrosomonas halophila TaxID=44576 RepID=A0A1H3GIW0_9PROT|nr:divalent-cation tolerance protein CutA [Nitrosomonas halophila]SDY03282.1 divalent cation tolerance protein [Nitrosomonas halophila]